MACELEPNMDEGGSINNRDFEEVTTLLAQSTLSASALGVPLNREPVVNPPGDGQGLAWLFVPLWCRFSSH